jgi:hypothetical protein
MRTLLDLRGNIPSFIHVSDGKLHDVHALDLLLPEAGAIYVMDRGYVDFARLHGLHLAGAFFVTRAKSNMNAHRVYSAPTDRATGIICDQIIALDGHYTSRHYPEHLRRIRLGGRRDLRSTTRRSGLRPRGVCADSSSIFAPNRKLSFFTLAHARVRVKKSRAPAASACARSAGARSTR